MCRFGLLLWSSAIASCLLASATTGQMYTNSTPLEIPTQPGTIALDRRASVYPSTIQVANAPAQIRGVRVSLNGLTHGFPRSLSILLVSPGGKKFHLMSGAGGDFSISNVGLEFSAEAPTALPTDWTIVRGTYKPSVFGGSEALPSPAPGLPYSTDLSTLYGTNANGTWSLYAWNIMGDESEAIRISGGWSISFVQPIETSFTYQGVVRKDGQPVTGAANVRFTLQPSAMSGAADVPLSAPLVRSFPGLERGVFSTELDFGDAILKNQELWLQIEAEAPPGSGFVALEPRTRLAIVPQAARAIKATTADFADVANSVPWSGVTGIPPQVLSPVSGFGLNRRHTGQFTNPGPQTSLTDSGTKGTVPEGMVLVNWSLSAFTNFPSTVYSFRFRIGQILSDPVVFSFNTANVHQTVSGCAMMNVPAGGAVNMDIVTERISGIGTLNYDFNDNVGYTVVHFKGSMK